MLSSLVTCESVSPQEGDERPRLTQFSIRRSRYNSLRLRLFRSSVPGLHVPLSTLRWSPYGWPCMTRGQWVATAFLCDAFIHDSTPVDPGAHHGLLAAYSTHPLPDCYTPNRNHAQDLGTLQGVPPPATTIA
jgi:hypothetical protein